MDNLQSHTGGFPLETETLDFLQEQSKLVMALSALGGTDTYILSGVKIENTNITAGYIVYNGEVIPFRAGKVGAQVSIYEATENVTYQEDADNDGEGDSKVAYTRREARIGTGGVVTFDLSDLKPFVEGIGGQIFKTFFKDVRLPYIGLIADIPTGWELCEILKGKFPVIYDDASSDYNTIGAEGGADAVTLTEAQMPKHNHKGNAAQAGSHTHTGTAAQAGDHPHTASTSVDGIHKHSGLTTHAGSHKHNTQYRKQGMVKFTGHLTTNSNDSDSGGYQFDIANAYALPADGLHAHAVNIKNAGQHTHNVNVVTAGAHKHSVTTDAAGAHTHKVTTDNKGSSAAHENRPSWKVIALIKYVG